MKHFLLLTYIAGFIFALSALWRSRTQQGATAWVVGLIFMPVLAIPLFIIFGRNKFFGYQVAKKKFDKRTQKEIADIDHYMSKLEIIEKKNLPIASLVRPSRQPGFTPMNEVKLLINGEETFASMLKELAAAKKYILFQFYIFRADKIGGQFADLLMKKAAEGVKVYFLCDKIGTSLKSDFIKKLESSGIEVLFFHSSKSWSDRLQINFRNHRKIVVVDGKSAFLGGFNIGDDYLGRWRDTHMRLRGPSVMAAQLSFVKDWHWATEKILDLEWRPVQYPGGSDALILHTGPADEIEVFHLTIVSMINSATKRVWITTPYFVPPESLLNALVLAQMRGLDVRLILPLKSDNVTIQFAMDVYIEKILKAGIKVFQYVPGILHEKAMLVDGLGMVGSANFDQRSLFLNFEIIAVSDDQTFVLEMEKMLEQDCVHSKLVTLDEVEHYSFLRKLRSRIINLLAPML